jgi:hypothetical protein
VASLCLLSFPCKNRDLHARTFWFLAVTCRCTIQKEHRQIDQDGAFVLAMDHGIHGGRVASIASWPAGWDGIFRSLYDSPCSQVRSVTCAYARTDTGVSEYARRSMSTAHGHGQGCTACMMEAYLPYASDGRSVGRRMARRLCLLSIVSAEGKFVAFRQVMAVKKYVTNKFVA